MTSQNVLEATKEAGFFENLTEEKIKQFLDFIWILNDSYILSDDITTHSKERRSYMAFMFMLLRTDIQGVKKPNQHQLAEAIDYAQGGAGLILFFEDMKRYLKDAVEYSGWDEESELVKFANDLFPLIEDSIKESFKHYYN